MPCDGSRFGQRLLEMGPGRIDAMGRSRWCTGIPALVRFTFPVGGQSLPRRRCSAALVAIIASSNPAEMAWSIASFLKLRKPLPGARLSTCRSQTRTSRFPCWKPGRSLCRNRMLGGPIQPRFTSHAVTIADAALIASLTSWRVAVG